MKLNRHVYENIDPIILDTQKSVAKAKLEMCNQALDAVLNLPPEIRDREIVADIMKSIKFNEAMLEECK